ncbi:stage II sporulation protein M [Alicyclobacillus ferrooxydans]|uniref:stage II sporulation protein M n=1 Tax=Alicyclobacillus ferrooxydans TaxID=471514 RepID=UPI0006D5B3B9|nr:stage II sporulation protein M [Alicyclobacillus ferrooxydans]
MLVQQFQARRGPTWQKLESLLQERNLSQTADKFTQFVRLYRGVASDLSYAQTFYPDHPVTEYLNGLVSVAHHRLYRRTSRSYTTIWTFYSRIFPQTFRQLSGYIFAATALSLIGALYGYMLVLMQPIQAYHLLPPSFLSQFHPNQAGPHAVDSPLISSIIMTHNIMVALMAFVGGITVGLYTAYALWQNGMILGVLAALFQTSGRATVFWSLIVPHGVTELLAIFIAGGAGLRLAHKMVAPSHLTRPAAFRLGALDAVKLMLGTVPMFMIAGTIEGFVTPSNIPVWMKFMVAGLTGLIWVIYFSSAGRRSSSRFRAAKVRRDASSSDSY